MKILLLTAALLTATACTNNLETADYGDAGTTAVALGLGAVEVGGLGALPGGVVPLAALAGKNVIRTQIEEGNMTPEDARTATIAMDGFGWLGTCNNTAVILGIIGVINPLTVVQTLGIGVACAAASVAAAQEETVE